MVALGNPDLTLLSTPATLRAYLETRGLVERGEPLEVHALGGGVSNSIVRVAIGERCMVLKQAQPKLRVEADWFAPVDRVLIEADCMQVLADLLPAGTVPRVLFVDPNQYLYGMECLPAGSVLWKTELLAGSVDLDVATRVGLILARMHQGTAEQPTLAARFEDLRILQALRLDPCFAYLVQRHPDCQSEIAAAIVRLQTARRCLVHGDYTPKNMLLHDDRLALLDYEIAHWGDPALDSGFLIAHLLLKAVRAPHWAARYVAAARAFWLSYASACAVVESGELERATAYLVPFLVLARLDSKSPVEYLATAEMRSTARTIARQGIQRPTARLDDLYELFLDAAARVAPGDGQTEGLQP